MNVLVTGGAGYVGSVLVPMLLERGHRVTVYDTMYFGCHLPKHDNLCIEVGDIRSSARFARAVQGQHAVIHLAALSNDESTNADPKLSRSINLDCLPMLLGKSEKAGVKRFIYASTSAVYGSTTADKVREDHVLNPEWRYATQKAAGENFVRGYATDDFCTTVVRPAALCGFSPRPRLDLTVNILTTHAIVNGVIQVWGGDQYRCSLHVQDMADAYCTLLEAPAEKINGETFNVGSDNHTVRELADIISRTLGATSGPRIETTAARDDRSYRIDSAKIASVVGWRPKHAIHNAVVDLANAFYSNRLDGAFSDDRYYNGRQIAKLIAGGLT